MSKLEFGAEPRFLTPFTHRGIVPSGDPGIIVGMVDEGRAARRVVARDAIRYCCEPQRLRRTGLIALTVGTILTGVNQGDVIAAGDETALTFVKVAFNYAVPFVVSNLGVLAGRRS